MESPERIFDSSLHPALRGFLHRPTKPNGNAIVLAHGAGSNCQAPLLISLAEAFAGAGLAVLRCDLPFRQVRPFGPPHPGNAARDREGLKRAVETMRKTVSGQLSLAGHSYGGRQATMLCADEPELADGLLLLSYPLHPPRKPEQLRVQHFPKLQTPALFVHGARDPFGTIGEMESALKLIPAKTQLISVENAGHDLGFKGKTKRETLPDEVVEAFDAFF
jgi:predicted alpha/beta-hydrolase family hydrolase